MAAMSAEEALTEVVDEILGRHHGILTSHRHGQDALDWLHERGYDVVPLRGVPLDPEVVR